MAPRNTATKDRTIEDELADGAEIDAQGGINLALAANPAGEIMVLPDEAQTLTQRGIAANAGSLRNYAGYRVLMEVVEMFYPRDGKQNGVRILGRLVDEENRLSMPATFISFSSPVRRTINSLLGNPPNAVYGKEPNQNAGFEPPIVVKVVDQGVTFTIE